MNACLFIICPFSKARSHLEYVRALLPAPAASATAQTFSQLSSSLAHLPDASSLVCKASITRCLLKIKI